MAFAPKVKFALDSPLEEAGFEPSVPRQKDNAFGAPHLIFDLFHGVG